MDGMSQPFIPAWAEKTLARNPIEPELSFLREFYDSWMAMHAIPNDKMHGKKREDAAKTVMENHKRLQRLKEPRQLGELLDVKP